MNMFRLVLFGLVASPLLAQTAELSGLISDPSGLPVPNATVNVQNQATRASHRVTSNQEGLYSVPARPPDSYDITIEAAGFKSIHQNGIVLEVDQRATLDFSLSIGSISESVTVEGSAPLLNQSDASVSTVIGNRFIENMPLNGRSFSSLIDLAPGVVLTPANGYEQGQFSVNGQRPDANYFMVDGGSANFGNAGSGGPLYQGGAGQLPVDQRVRRREQLSIAGCIGGISHPDFYVCAGIRSDTGRSDLGGYQVRHQRVSWNRFRVLPQRQDGRQ